MPYPTLAVYGYKVNYRATWQKILYITGLCIILLGFTGWYVLKHFSGTALAAMLFFSGVACMGIIYYYTKIAFKKAGRKTQCILSPQGIKEKQLRSGLSKRFIPWSSIRDYKEGAAVNAENVSFLRIRLQNSHNHLIIPCRDNQSESYRRFIEGFREAMQSRVR